MLQARPRKGGAARVVVAVGSGIALLALVALVYSGSNDMGGTLAEKGQDDSSAKAKPKAAAPMTPAQRDKIFGEIKSLKAKISTEESQASKLDSTVTEEEGSIKSVLLKAKKMEVEAVKAKHHAVQRKQKVCVLMCGCVDVDVYVWSCVCGWGFELV